MATLLERNIAKGKKPQPKQPARAAETWALHVFRVQLGWMAALGRDGVLVQLSIGCKSPAEAVANLNADWVAAAETVAWCPDLERKLRAYAAGEQVDFSDVPVLDEGRTSFQKRVLDLTRRIPYGDTLSYGELARRAGRPGAARAVGNTMASNRCPLVIPCHRVVHTSGRIGHFSAPQGSRMKRRLLDLES